MEVKVVKGIIGSNTFVVKCGDAIVIVDAGADLNNVKKALGEQMPSAILLTHEHYDHTLCVADYVAAFDCDVYAHTATVEELRTHNLGAKLGWKNIVKTPNNFDKFHSIKKDCSFKIADVSIEAITAPGHSTGCVLFKIGSGLFTGDVLFSNTIGRTDFIPDGPALMQQSLIKLQDIQFETAYHGHSSNSDFAKQQKNIKSFIK